MMSRENDLLSQEEKCNKMVDRDIHLWCTVYFFDIVDPYYDQLTPVKTSYPLTVSRDHIVGSSSQLIEVTCFRKVDCWPSVGFPIGSWAHVRLTC